MLVSSADLTGGPIDAPLSGMINMHLVTTLSRAAAVH